LQLLHLILLLLLHLIFAVEVQCKLQVFDQKELATGLAAAIMFVCTFPVKLAADLGDLQSSLAWIRELIFPALVEKKHDDTACKIFKAETAHKNPGAGGLRHHMEAPLRRGGGATAAAAAAWPAGALASAQQRRRQTVATTD
jgi:hypothetical protein